jgi:uncharacterized membrane protein
MSDDQFGIKLNSMTHLFSIYFFVLKEISCQASPLIQLNVQTDRKKLFIIFIDTFYHSTIVLKTNRTEELKFYPFINLTTKR